MDVGGGWVFGRARGCGENSAHNVWPTFAHLAAISNWAAEMPSAAAGEYVEEVRVKISHSSVDGMFRKKKETYPPAC